MGVVMPQRPVLNRKTDIKLLYCEVDIRKADVQSVIFYGCQGLVFVIRYNSWSMKHGATVTLNSKNHIPAQSEPHCPSGDFHLSMFWKIISLDLNFNGHQFMSRISSGKGCSCTSSTIFDLHTSTPSSG